MVVSSLCRLKAWSLELGDPGGSASRTVHRIQSSGDKNAIKMGIDISHCSG